MLQAAGLKFTGQQGRGRAVCPHKCGRGTWHSGQQCLSIGLWGWLRSDPHGAVQHVAGSGRAARADLPSEAASPGLRFLALQNWLQWQEPMGTAGSCRALLRVSFVFLSWAWGSTTFFPSLYLLKNLIKLMQMVKYLEVFLLGRVSFSSCLHSTLLWGHTCSLNSCLWCLCTERIPVSLITKLGKGKTEFSNWWHIYTRIVTL